MLQNYAFANCTECPTGDETHVYRCAAAKILAPDCESAPINTVGAWKLFPYNKLTKNWCNDQKDDPNYWYEKAKGLVESLNTALGDITVLWNVAFAGQDFVNSTIGGRGFHYYIDLYNVQNGGKQYKDIAPMFNRYYNKGHGFSNYCEKNKGHYQCSNENEKLGFVPGSTLN